MIIEWLWNRRGFAFPQVKTETKSTKEKIRVGKTKTNAKKRKR